MTQAIDLTDEELETLFVLTRDARVKYPGNTVLPTVNRKLLTALIQSMQLTAKGGKL